MDDDDYDGSDFFSSVLWTVHEDAAAGVFPKVEISVGGEKWKSIYFSFHMHFLNKKKTQRGLFTQSCKLFYTPAFKRKCWTFARNFISFLFYNTKYQYFCVLGLCSLVHYLNVALSPPFYVSIWTFHLSLSL